MGGYASLPRLSALVVKYSPLHVDNPVPLTVSVVFNASSVPYLRNIPLLYTPGTGPYVSSSSPKVNDGNLMRVPDPPGVTPKGAPSVMRCLAVWVNGAALLGNDAKDVY